MDDDYPTCLETYATLRIGVRGDPTEVARALGTDPTRSLDGAASPRHTWRWSSQHHVDSRDVRRHIDWVLDVAEPMRDALAAARAVGATADVFCFWVSAHGHGGPTLSPAQMRRLAALDLDCGFDVYFDD